MVVRFFTVFTLLVLAISNSYAATISVRTDRSQISLNESFQVIFEANGEVDDAPDFSPLETQFQVLSTVQSSNFSVVNGQITSSKRWTLTLMANEAGTQMIPSISFGIDLSPTIQVNITNSGAAISGNQQQDEIYLEATASPKDPYVQSQVIYTLKLYRSVAITKASLGDPEVVSGDAVLERLDDDKTYETTINGRVYQVIERNFAVYPQTSGEVTIGTVNFMGQIARSRYGLDPFGAPPRTMVRRTQPVTLNVRSVPDTFSGNSWLPAENLTLAEEWSGDPMQLRVGEPITRTLIMTARGLISSQLPELPQWGIPELKFYPDRPVMGDEKFDTGITSTRREKAAVIPNEPGNYILPEISIPWWNTRTDSADVAVIPERIIEVLPATGISSDPVSVSGLSQQIPDILDLSAPEPEQQAVTQNLTIETDIDSGDAIWKWVSLGLALLWLITLFVWRYGTGRSTVREDKNQHIKKTQKINALISEVEASCRRNDALQTKTSLLRWSKQTWPEHPPLNISEIAQRTGDPLSSSLLELNKVLYAQGEENWDGGALLNAFNKMAPKLSRQDDKKVSRTGRLEPLFRIQ
jgi:hypothetical protein